MSDLVRGLAREAAPVVEAPRVEPPPRETPRPSPPPAQERTSYGQLLDADTAAAVEPRPPAASDEPSVLLGELQELLLEVRGLVRGTGEFPWARLSALMERAVTSLERSPDLFWAANNPAAPPGLDYVAFHQARVAVTALRVGANVGYDRRRLVSLGMAGCLIDVGLWQLPDTLPRRLDALTGDEQAAYRSHPRLSAELIRRWGPPDEAIAQAVLEHHEREQGQGFPQGLTGTAVEPDAKVLGLADTYTGLTLPPTARPRLRPHEAVREIVKSRNEAFPAPLIKALLSEISVFPPGTVVRLNTEEIGRVVAVNRHHPLRPRVEIMADSKGQRLSAAKTVDLSESPFIYITGPVTEGPR
ncbi:MAG TPA: HD domain-containing phosphohydrolase [Methylomirabilota bacterium]|nr:HD domain-containing phosphohydrolase [Methylomirabilota bacterium]